MDYLSIGDTKIEENIDLVKALDKSAIYHFKDNFEINIVYSILISKTMLHCKNSFGINSIYLSL